MSDSSQGPGWWVASDGKWYPPEQHPSPWDQQAAPTQAPAPHMPAMPPTAAPPQAASTTATPQLGAAGVLSDFQHSHYEAPPMSMPAPVVPATMDTHPGRYMAVPEVAVAPKLWNYGSGVIYAQVVVLLALATSAYGAWDGGGGSDARTQLILVAAGAFVAIVALFMLFATQAIAGFISLLGGATASIGLLWRPINNWSVLSAQGLDFYLFYLSGLIPVVLGLLALGLRRSHHQ